MHGGISYYCRLQTFQKCLFYKHVHPENLIIFGTIFVTIWHDDVVQPVTSSAVLLVFPSALLTMANHFYQYCYYILHLDFKPLLIKAVLKLACLIGQLELAVCMSVVSNIHLNPYISPGYLYSKVLWIPALFSELSEA